MLLQMIQENLQEELQGLAQSSLALQKAAGELGTSGQAVQQLADREPGELACRQRERERESPHPKLAPTRLARAAVRLLTSSNPSAATTSEPASAEAAEAGQAQGKRP